VQISINGCSEIARKGLDQKLFTATFPVKVLLEIKPPLRLLAPVGNMKRNAVPFGVSTLALIILTGISGKELYVKLLAVNE